MSCSWCYSDVVTCSTCAATSKLKRVAMFHPAMDSSDMRIGGDPTYAIIFDEMKRLGRSEGINLIVERYSAEGRTDDFRRIFQRIAATQPDAILTMGTAAAVKLLQSEARSVPIVAWRRFRALWSTFDEGRSYAR